MDDWNIDNWDICKINTIKAIINTIEIACNNELDRYKQRVDNLVSLYRNKQKTVTIKEYKNIKELSNFSDISEIAEKLNELFEYYKKSDEQINIYCDALELIEKYCGIIDPDDFAKELKIEIKLKGALKNNDLAVLYIDENSNPIIKLDKNMNAINQKKILSYEIIRYLLTPVRFCKDTKMVILHSYNKNKNINNYESELDEKCHYYAIDLFLPNEYFLKFYNLNKEKFLKCDLPNFMGVDQETFEEKKKQLNIKDNPYTKQK